MDIKQEFIRMPKEFVYDMYRSLAYNIKDYDDITRGKMLEEIIKTYKQKDYLFHICTRKELDFLNKFQNKKLSKEDYFKYEWEIKELNNKCIFSRITLEVFSQQKQNVKEALQKYNKEGKDAIIDMVTMMIGIVKTNGEILTKAFTSMLTGIIGPDEEFIDYLYAHPLYHHYCGFYIKNTPSLGENQEVTYYRKYEWDLDLLDDARKQYGIAGTMQIDTRDFEDIFYYGFPIRKPSVKKMYDIVSKRKDKELIFSHIDQSRLLNSTYLIDFFIKEEELHDIICKAMGDIPSAAMNGFTPNQYKNQKEDEIILNQRFSKVNQVNAHLPKNAADEYYKLYFALLEYTNKKYKIIPSLKKIYKQEGLNATELNPINDYLWDHREIIDDFIKDNNYKFNKEQLETIEGFKSAVKSDKFLVVGFDRDYTEILSEDGKLYMIKGVRDNLDRIIKSELPVFISTTLLMFKGNIIYNSFLSTLQIKFGNDIKQYALKEKAKAMKYYHL